MAALILASAALIFSSADGLERIGDDFGKLCLPEEVGALLAHGEFLRLGGRDGEFLGEFDGAVLHVLGILHGLRLAEGALAETCLGGLLGDGEAFLLVDAGHAHGVLALAVLAVERFAFGGAGLLGALDGLVVLGLLLFRDLLPLGLQVADIGVPLLALHAAGDFLLFQHGLLANVGLASGAGDAELDDAGHLARGPVGGVLFGGCGLLVDLSDFEGELLLGGGGL